MPHKRFKVFLNLCISTVPCTELSLSIVGVQFMFIIWHFRIKERIFDILIQFSSVQSLSGVRLFATP